MANNLVIGNNGAYCKTAISFADAGLNATNCLIIFKIANPNESWNPAPGSLNTITGFEEGSSYYIRMLAAMDLSANLVPPLTGDETGNITPAAPTVSSSDDGTDMFNWTNNPNFTALSDYEYTLDGGTTVATVTAKPISIGNVNKAIGQVGVRVKAATGRNVSPWLFNSIAFTQTGGGGNTTPNAPTAPSSDNAANQFDWTNTPGITSLSDYEYTLDGGTTYSQVTAKPIAVGNVNKAIGQVGVRVKAATGRNVSPTLFNTIAFTNEAPPPFYDNFVGAAGALSAHTPPSGSYTALAGTPTINGGGKLVLAIGDGMTVPVTTQDNILAQISWDNRTAGSTLQIILSNAGSLLYIHLVQGSGIFRATINTNAGFGASTGTSDNTVAGNLTLRKNSTNQNLLEAVLSGSDTVASFDIGSRLITALVITEETAASELDAIVVY